MYKQLEEKDLIIGWLIEKGRCKKWKK
jgi:hypothetical protein